MEIVLSILGLLVFLFVLNVFVQRPATRIFVIFLGLSICFAVLSITEHIEINNVKKQGHKVNATVTEIAAREEENDTEYDISFEYRLEGKTYTYIDRSGDNEYPVGDSVEAYIDSDSPQELHFDEAFPIWPSILFLGIGIVISFANRNMSEKDWETIEIPD